MILTKLSMLSSLALSLVSTANQIAFAAAECTVNGREVDCAELGNQLKGVLGWGLGGVLVILALGIWATVFWILMIVHASKHEVDNKAMWIILMVFTGVVGALIYYFAVKRKFNRQSAQMQQSPLTPPPSTQSPPPTSPPPMTK